MKILLSAYACNPEQGSEPGVGWNWLKEISKRNEVWALFYDGQGQREALEAGISGLPNRNNIHLQPIPVPKILRGRLYRLRYEIWQWHAYRKAIQLSKTIHFDLVHHVTIAAWWNCGYLWKLNIPFILGPISGGQRTPAVLYAFLRHQDALHEWMRDRMLDFSWRVWQRPHRAIRHAALVFAANVETLAMAKTIRKDKPTLLFSEIGVDPDRAESQPSMEPHPEINLLWVGKLIPTKNFGLLLEVLKRIDRKIRWRLRVIGDGYLKDHWQGKISAAGLADRITFLGAIDHADVEPHYRWADVLVFSSAREATGSVVLEAMSYGVPVLALDLHGVKNVIDPSCGILIPVKDKAQVMDDLTSAILTLGLHPQLGKALGLAAKKKIGEQYRWDQRGEDMQKYYQTVVCHP